MGVPDHPIHMTREGVAGTEFESLPIEASDFTVPPAEQRWSLACSDEALGLTVGVWTTTDMQEAFGPYPGDEFMAVIDGTTRMIDGDGGETAIRAGEAFCVHNRHPVSWKQVGPMRKVFMIHDPPDAASRTAEPAGPGVVVWGPDHLDALQAEKDDGDRSVQRQVRFTSVTGAMTAGTVEIAARSDWNRSAGLHELLYVIAGVLHLDQERDHALTVEAGEAVFVPAGCAVRIAAPGTVRAYFARCAAG